jgi:hypothetical protein
MRERRQRAFGQGEDGCAAPAELRQVLTSADEHHGGGEVGMVVDDPAQLGQDRRRSVGAGTDHG